MSTKPTSVSTGGSKTTAAEANYALTLLTIVYALGYADRSVINLLMEPIKQEYQLSDTIMGLITGFGFTAFQTLLALPVARWADTYRRVTILAVGLLLWSAMTGISGLATSAIFLAIARMGVGVGEAALTGPSHSLLSDYFPKDTRARAFSLMGAGGEIGIVLALLIGGWVGHLWGWRAAFFVAGAPGILVAMVLLLTMREPEREASRTSVAAQPKAPLAESLADLASRKSFIVAVLASMAMGLLITGVTMWSASYLRRIFHLDLAAIGTSLALLRAVLAVGGSIAGGAITTICIRRFGQRWFMLTPAIICALAALSLVVLLLAPSVPIALIGLGLVNMTVGAQLGPVFSLVQTVAPIRHRGFAAALFVSITQLFGMGVGGLVIGATSDALTGAHGADALRYALFIPVAGGLLGAFLYAYGARFVVADIAKNTAASDAA